MTGQANDLQWYIARDGKQHGPLSDIEMRTFVAHNYLRQTDLIWRPGMPEWQPAPQVFPAVFQPPAQPPPQPAAQAPIQAQASPQQQPAFAPRSDFEIPSGPPASNSGSALKRAAIAATVVSVIGGSAYGLVLYREPLLKLVSGGASLPAKPAPKKEEPPKVAAVATPEKIPDTAAAPAPEAAPAATAVAAATPPPTPPAAEPTPAAQVAATAPVVSTTPPVPPSIEGSALDARLQKIPVWTTLKKDYPDWYVGNIAAADKLIADKKTEAEVATHLAQGLVTLRRQNADKALSASPEKLKKIASTFLDHLKALREQSISSCFGYISKGETSPAVIQSLQSPENATVFNSQFSAILEAAEDGGKSPVKHDAAVKADYDLLIKELNKIGWKENDLQIFSNPKMLAQQEPAQVCKMVQDWFVAHLAIGDKAAQNRLLYETLKPVVSG